MTAIIPAPPPKPRKPYIQVGAPTDDNPAFGWSTFHKWIDMIFVDHGISHVIFNTRSRVADGVWRSSQPWPYQLRQAARAGVKSILNLRGARACGAYALELAEVKRLGMTIHNVNISSRSAPPRALIEALDELFRTMTKPVLLHCKSGADRAGIVAVLYLLMAGKKTVAEARRHLAMRYGHMRVGAQGALDAFLETYEREGEARGQDLLTWARGDYDPDAILARFRARRRMAWLSDLFIRRE